MQSIEQALAMLQSTLAPAPCMAVTAHGMPGGQVHGRVVHVLMQVPASHAVQLIGQPGGGPESESAAPASPGIGPPASG
jgi:hypothetical protein